MRARICLMNYKKYNDLIILTKRGTIPKEYLEKKSTNRAVWHTVFALKDVNTMSTSQCTNGCITTTSTKRRIVWARAGRHEDPRRWYVKHRYIQCLSEFHVQCFLLETIPNDIFQYKGSLIL